MKKLLYLLPLLLLLGLPRAHAASPLYVYCIQASSVQCNTTSNPGTGNQGDAAWLAFGKLNQDLAFLSGFWNQPANSIECNSTNAAGGFGFCTAGTNVTISGGVISFTGGGGSGSVTSITCGTGLSGGVITGIGTCSLINPVPVSLGGTGTLSPGLIGGSNVSVTGTWPNQTISFSGVFSGASTQFVAQTGAVTLSPTNTKATVNATSGAQTTTLPTAVGDTNLYCVTKTDTSTNTVTVNTTSAQTISGQASWVIQFQYNTMCMSSDNSNWWII